MKELKNNKQLNEYMREFEEDVKVSTSNLREKSFLISGIRSKWLNYFFVEKENLERIHSTKNKYIKTKLSTSKNQDSVLRLKNEENILKNDETLAKLNNLVAMSQQNIEYLQMALDVLANFGFQLKTIVDVLKLEKQ